MAQGMLGLSAQSARDRGHSARLEMVYVSLVIAKPRCLARSR